MPDSEPTSSTLSPEQAVDALLAHWSEGGLFHRLQTHWPEIVEAGRKAEQIKGIKMNSIVWYPTHHALGAPEEAPEKIHSMLQELHDKAQAGRTGFIDVGQKTLLNALFDDKARSFGIQYSVLDILRGVASLKKVKGHNVSPALIEQAEAFATELKSLQQDALAQTAIVSSHYGSMGHRRRDEYGDPPEPRGCWSAVLDPRNLLKRRRNPDSDDKGTGAAR